MRKYSIASALLRNLAAPSGSGQPDDKPDDVTVETAAETPDEKRGDPDKSESVSEP